MMKFDIFTFLVSIAVVIVSFIYGDYIPAVIWACTAGVYAHRVTCTLAGR